MKDKKGGELICKRPETIVEARFNLTKKQNDILDMVFATIKNDDNLEFEIKIEKYAKLYKLQNQSNVYSDVKKAIDSFKGKGFSILNKETKREDYFPWFSRITYLPREGKIFVELGKTLKQIFLDVKRACFYQIKYSLNFKSIYSQRLYYYLKIFENTGFRIDNLDELKKKLVCPSSYKNFADFKRFVMVPAYNDINGNSDINFEYEPIKTGRKVTTIKFYIKANIRVQNEIAVTQADAVAEAPQEETYIETIKSIIKSAIGKEITDKTANEFYKSAAKHKYYGNEPLALIKEVAQYSKTQDIKKGFVGWFKSTVSTYERPIATHKVNTFNDYEQRQYDFGELEKALLGQKKVNLSDITK